MLTKNVIRLIFLITFVSTMLGCAGSNQALQSGMSIASAGLSIAGHSEIAIGISAINTVYSSTDAKSLAINGAIQGTSTALLSNGHLEYGISTLLIADAAVKKDITKINPILVLQSVCIITGQFYLSAGIGIAYSIYKVANPPKDTRIVNKKPKVSEPAPAKKSNLTGYNKFLDKHDLSY